MKVNKGKLEQIKNLGNHKAEIKQFQHQVELKKKHSFKFCGILLLIKIMTKY